ncbi:MAG: VOC family protein [Bacteroidetes bacterium]|nr:VOC family protein [Bacteroidota bacterium]
MKLRGLSRIVLRANRLSETENFYRDILGLPVRYRIGRDGVVLAVGPDELVLRQAEAGLSSEAPDPRLAHFGFDLPHPEDVDRWAKRFREAGVPILWGPFWRAGRRVLFILDPDGNRIELSAPGEQAELQGQIQGRGRMR